MAQLISKRKIKKDFYEDLPELEYFDEQMLSSVEIMACTMEPQEVLDFYGIELDDIRNPKISHDAHDAHDAAEDLVLTPDYIWFMKAFKRGRSMAKLQASQKLFQSMSTNQGKDACLAYLVRYSEKFKEPISPNSIDEPNKNFSFTVQLD